jgi:hypothetical protein
MPQGGAPFWRLPILGQAIADTGRSLLLVGAKTLLIPAIRPVRAVRGALGMSEKCALPSPGEAWFSVGVSRGMTAVG